jgi:hypothetical protein
MYRKRTTPPTASSVRQLAAKRGFLLAKEGKAPRCYKLFDLSGRRATPIPSRRRADYTWQLVDADAWLRKQSLLRDR